MLEVNQILNDTYLIKERIGSGGGGIIYKAYHVRMRKDVAIKLIKDSVKSDFYNRSEVDVLKNLKNDYLPQVLDFVEDGDDVYTVMEFVEGQNFKQLITSGKIFSEKQVKKYALQLCEAVRYLHDHVPPIIHSDIKPANVMLTMSDNICLIDFNISMMSDNGIAVSKGGSRDFGAPEQFRRVINAPYEVDEFHEETRFIGDDETEILSDESEIYHSRSAKTKNASKAYIDIRTDIYGIGATIYYMLTSRVPVGGRVDFRGINCSYAVKDAIEKAMSSEPAKRFRNVSEFEAALKRHISVKRIVLPVVAGAVVAASGYSILILTQNIEKSNENNMLSTAQRFIVEQNYEQATVEFNKIIELDPKITTNDPSVTSTTQNTPELFPVPNLVGLSKTEAIVAIENAGLSYELSSAESDTVEKDYVISQNVTAGASVPANYKIMLTVSEGRKIIVPSVINKNISEAVGILDNAGITYSVEYADDSRVDKDHVFKQSIKSGTKIDERRKMTIYVSNHENQIETVTGNPDLWQETDIDKRMMYVSENCYSRDRAIIGATPVSRYYKGDLVEVSAITDTGFYKFNEGQYIHSDYLTNKLISISNESAQNDYSLNCTNQMLTVGYSTILTVSDINNASVKWSSSNTSVATVSSNGKVTGEDVGHATIYADINGTILSCDVTVVAGKLSISTTEVSMEKGEIKYITVRAKGSHGLKAEPNEKSIVKASWISPWDGDDIKLKLTAKESGKTIVKIYLTKDPSIYATISVTVN